MVLTEQQTRALSNIVKEGLDRVPSLVKGTVLEYADSSAKQVPAILRTASVGDVIDAYLELRRKGYLR